jgi:hypothetical protein
MVSPGFELKTSCLQFQRFTNTTNTLNIVFASLIPNQCNNENSLLQHLIQLKLGLIRDQVIFQNL